MLLYFLLLVATEARCPASKDSPHQTQELRMEAIKVQIMSKLRLRQDVASNITRNSLNFHTKWQVDDYYNEFKRKQHDSVHELYSDSHDYFSETKMVFRFPEETIISPNTRHYMFDASLERFIATGATLKIAISDTKLSKELRRNKMSVKLYKLTQSLEDTMRTLNRAQEQIFPRPSHSDKIRKIKTWDQTTYNFDLKLAFSSWSQWPEYNFGILICVGRCFQKSPDIKFEDVFIGVKEGNRPLLSIDTYEENHSRKKRSGYDCVNPKYQKKCCRYSYFVRFEDLGLGWILAPDGYNAYYCSGDCPFMYLSEQKSSLYYTFVLARANYNNPMASPRPCCTPAVLSDLTIMFSSGRVDSQGQPSDIEIHNLKDMVVEECGCS